MNHNGASRSNVPPIRRDNRPPEEIHGRAALPFHRAPHNAACHDLLVMNHHPHMTVSAIAPACGDCRGVIPRSAG